MITGRSGCGEERVLEERVRGRSGCGEERVLEERVRGGREGREERLRGKSGCGEAGRVGRLRGTLG